MTLPLLYAAVQRTYHALHDLIHWVVFEAHIEPLELWTTLNALTWGLWLMNPWMDVFSTVYYMGMSRMPEGAWGAIAVTGAVVQLAGRLTGHPRLIRSGARVLAMLWMFGAVALAMQNWRFATIVMYPAIACASLLVSYRASAGMGARRVVA